MTHYSAGPYAVALAGGVGCARIPQGLGPAFSRTTASARLAGACVIAPWFAWSVAQYGWRATFLVELQRLHDAEGRRAIRWSTMALNLRDSLIPPQVRGFRGTLFAQTSTWGALRDQAFLIYQLNPLLALGLRRLDRRGEGGAAGRRGGRPPRPALLDMRPGRGRPPELRLVRGSGSLRHRPHLPPVARAPRPRLPRVPVGPPRPRVAGPSSRAGPWTSASGSRCSLQSRTSPSTGGSPLPAASSEVSRTYSGVSQANLSEKIIAQLAYFADIMPAPPALVLALLGAILCMALMRARPTPDER